MAKITRGYPFAFQTLGYVYWNERDRKSLEDILPIFDQCLYEYIYTKLWSELSAKDKMVTKAIVNCESSKIKDIREMAGMNSELFSVYRDRLKGMGMVDTSEFGHISVILPRFKEFVEMYTSP